MVAPKKSGDEKKETFPELQAFANARKLPAIFIFLLNESIDFVHSISLRELLGDRNFEELDLVINSVGGRINAAYQIVQILRLHTKKLNVCVPFYAMSAATLICIGGDTIVVDELAQLGPLDTQIREKRKRVKPSISLL